MKKSLIMSLMAIVVGVIQTLSAVDLANVGSSSTIVPGEWNSNFSACRSYAESKGVPMLVFWSSPGCAKCNQLKNACNTETFVKWRKSKGIVMAFSEGDGTVKSFARNSSGQFPYMRLYWPAGNVDLRFTGRSTTIPANGSTLEAKLMNCVDSYLKNWKPGSAPSEVNPPDGDDENPLVPVVGPEWKKARKIWGSITDADGNVAGRVLVSAAKVNAKKGTAKVKLQIVNLLGKMKTIGYKDLTVNKTTKGYLSGPIGNGTVSIKGSSISGTVAFENQTYTISSQLTGGSLKDGGYVFALESAPRECQGLPVLEGTKFLPMAQKFTSASSRWVFPTKGNSPRYNSKTGAFVMAATENPSQLKLSYATSSGYFKGQFTVYAVRGKSLKKYVATVGGYMVGTKGHGVATIRNVGSFPCAVKFGD